MRPGGQLGPKPAFSRRDNIGNEAADRVNSRESDAAPLVSDSASSRQGYSAKGGQASPGPERARNYDRELENHMRNVQRTSARVLEEDDQSRSGRPKFRLDWRSAPGHRVLTRFRLQDPPPAPPRKEVPQEADAENAEGLTEEEKEMRKKVAEEVAKQEREERSKFVKEYGQQPYRNYSGLRFPTLETAESYNYHQDTGLDKLVERSFPITVPGYRRLDPYLREYIHFLHKVDPARFTIARIAERYRLREKTVSKVVQEWSVNRWLTSSGLTSLRDKQATKESAILKKKEEMYAKWVGWDQLGDEEDASDDEEELGEFRGWRPTSDWVRKQKVEVEMMSAFPMMEKRSPMPKRVDVDLTLSSTRSHKVINWIDPTDKVVF